MLYCDRIGAPGGINFNKTSASKECDICHYWYFLDKRFRFQPCICKKCHDVLMMSMNHSIDIAILNINSADFYCIINGINKSEAVILLQKANLNGKSGTL